MALPSDAVLTDPDQVEEPDIEIRHTDSFLLVRAEEMPSRPRETGERDGRNSRDGLDAAQR